MEDSRVKEYLEGIVNKKIDLDMYAHYCQSGSIEQLLSRASPLEGYKWLDINTSCFGGGVAVTLSAAIPFFRALGINADWKVLNGEDAFFSITKRMHNGLQGIINSFTKEELAYYQETVFSFIKNLNSDYDAIEVNDFQLIPTSQILSQQTSLFWRSHLDTTNPEKTLANFYSPFLNRYDYHLFTHPSYLFSQRGRIPAYQVLPTLDPLLEKNSIESEDSAKRILSDNNITIDPDRHIISSCARFDIHKNQISIVRMFREYKERFKEGTQLVVMGSSDTMDSPDEYNVYGRLLEEAEKDKDIYVLNNQPDKVIGSVLHLSDVFVHLATKEGFGMAITEAMWYETPVVCASTPGISLQVHDDYNGFLIQNIEEASNAVEILLGDKKMNARMGSNARQYVKNNLLTDSFARRYIEIGRAHV